MSDYDEIEQLIDGDPIELGRRLRAALADLDNRDDEVGMLRSANDQLEVKNHDLRTEVRQLKNDLELARSVADERAVTVIDLKRRLGELDTERRMGL